MSISLKKKGKGQYCDSYERVMKFKRKHRSMQLVRKLEKDLAELKKLLRKP